MNTVSVVVSKVVRPVIKHTRGTLTRGLQSVAHHNGQISTPPPSAGMLRAWQTLQEDSWVTTQRHLRPQTLETFNAVSAEERSILGSRNLGLFEKNSNSEDMESRVRVLMKGFKFD